MPSPLPALCLAVLTALGAPQTPAEELIEAGHWKRARVLVEARLREAPDDPLATFLLSQIRAAFGDRTSPLKLAERAVALDGRTAKYHRQVAEAAGVMAQQANPIQQLLLARRFRAEIGITLDLDPQDRQALRDLVEFYILAPGIAGGDLRKAAETADRLFRVDAAEGLLARARVAVARNDRATEESMLVKAAEAEPASYRAAIAYAKLRLSRSELPAAESAARSALRIDPDRVEAYALLAAVYARQSRWSDLEAILTASRERIPDDLVPFYRAAEELATGPEFEKAKQYLAIYLSEPAEGNEPTTAQASAMLRRRRPASSR